MSSESKVMRVENGRARVGNRAVILTRDEWDNLCFLRDEYEREEGESLTLRDTLSRALHDHAWNVAELVGYGPTGRAET